MSSTAKKAAYRTARFLNACINRAIMLFGVIALLVSAYLVLDVGYVYYSAGGTQLPFGGYMFQESKQQQYSMEDLSSECIGWIEMDDTTISYPVMHCDNNRKYLNTDPLGDYNIAGSIFLDFRNLADFSDQYSLLYGHHMANGYMFGALDYYEDPDYMLAHQTGTLKLRDGTQYALWAFAFSVVEATDDTVFTPENMLDTDEFVSEHSVYNGDHGSHHILALSTCRNPGETMRSVLFCDMTPKGVSENQS